MMIYVNGQDIARLVLGSLENAEWQLPPRVIEARPEQYLLELENFLGEQGIARTEITGFVLVKGPGSATSLRTSHAMVNALAFALSVPVVSIEKAPDAADAETLNDITSQAPHAFALPVYAQSPNITKTNRDALKRKTA
jgi:hypothetical protein